MTHDVGAAWRGSILVAAVAVVTSFALVRLDDQAVPWWPFELRKALAFLLMPLVARLVSSPGRAFAQEAFVGTRAAYRVLAWSS